MLKKILQELISIRKELQAIKRGMESEEKLKDDDQKLRNVLETVNCMIKNTKIKW